MNREQDVFYSEEAAKQWQDCCEKCGDVHYEKTFPAHTAYLACRNLKCECHKEAKINHSSNEWEPRLMDFLPPISAPWTTQNQDKLFILIGSLLAQTRTEERARVVEEIKGMKIYDKEDTALSDIARHGYNQAIDNILATITSKGK